jgi:hypothetical protein
MEIQTYFYKNSLEKTGWTPFGLNSEDGKKWNCFCVKLGIQRPDHPNPYFDDYMRFLDELKATE